MARLDIVIFGATGFTGKHAVYQMSEMAAKNGNLTWGVAGRSQSKLETLMADVTKTTGKDHAGVKIFIADVTDEASLKEMCSSCKVIINCSGPYRLYGEPVVKAAIECKTDYVDVTGEPEFMELMQLKYNTLAQEAGVHVIHACGFDSIPNDLGVMFLKKNFDGTVNSIESYVSAKAEGQTGAVINYGTWETVVHSIANHSELAPLRKKLYPDRLPTFKPKLQPKSVIHKKGNHYCVPFLGSDASVVYRTQRHLYEHDHQRPIQFKPYVKLGSLPATILGIFAATVIFIMSKMSFTRNLLLDYPKFFSMGYVSKDGPSEATMKNTVFKFELYGEGWARGADVENTPPNKKMVVKVTGVNPGYGATVSAVLLSAITTLRQKAVLHGSGGVLTTGAAFQNTDLVEKLIEHNLKFEVVDNK